MTQLIEKTDPRYFTVTSDEPYDRHTYKVVYHDGKEKVVDSWEEVQSIWWNSVSYFVSHVEVMDRKKTKSKGGGFR